MNDKLDIGAEVPRCRGAWGWRSVSAFLVFGSDFGCAGVCY